MRPYRCRSRGPVVKIQVVLYLKQANDIELKLNNFKEKTKKVTPYNCDLILTRTTIDVRCKNLRIKNISVRPSRIG